MLCLNIRFYYCIPFFFSLAEHSYGNVLSPSTKTSQSLATAYTALQVPSPRPGPLTKKEATVVPSGDTMGGARPKDPFGYIYRKDIIAFGVLWSIDILDIAFHHVYFYF